MATETQESVGVPNPASHETPPALLQFDPGIGIWTLVAFVLLLLLLKQFAWKPILDAVDERDRKIKDSLSAADRLSEDFQKQSEEQKRILAASHEQAAKIVGEARKSAEQLKDQIVESAEHEKTRILRTATDEINSLTLQAKGEIKDFSADLAIKMAEKIIHDQLDPVKAKKLTDTMIKDFKL